jgi:hypothetical protein
VFSKHEPDPEERKIPDHVSDLKWPLSRPGADHDDIKLRGDPDPKALVHSRILHAGSLHLVVDDADRKAITDALTASQDRFQKLRQLVNDRVRNFHDQIDASTEHPEKAILARLANRLLADANGVSDVDSSANVNGYRWLVHEADCLLLAHMLSEQKTPGEQLMHEAVKTVEKVAQEVSAFPTTFAVHLLRRVLA